MPFWQITPEYLTRQIKPLQEIANPQQTASYISILTFSYLDYIIMKAYRTPHLTLDEMPPLQVEDSSSVLTAKAFPVRTNIL